MPSPFQDRSPVTIENPDPEAPSSGERLGRKAGSVLGTGCSQGQPASRDLNEPRRRNVMNSLACIACGYVYDESSGLPEDGFAAGTGWSDLPGDWSCPRCGVAKTGFQRLEIR